MDFRAIHMISVRCTQKISDVIMWTKGAVKNAKFWVRLGGLGTKKFCSLFHGKIRKRLIVSRDILVLFTLYKLVHLLAAQNSVRMIEFIFRRSRSTLFVKTLFSGAFLNIRAENASESRFLMPKLDHSNTPDDNTILAIWTSIHKFCTEMK